MLARTASLYDSETRIALVFPMLSEAVNDTEVRRSLEREQQENRRRRLCLEGLLAVLKRAPAFPGGATARTYLQDFSILLKRLAVRHSYMGYKTAIVVAMALGQVEMVILLRQAFGSRKEK